MHHVVQAMSRQMISQTVINSFQNRSRTDEEQPLFALFLHTKQMAFGNQLRKDTLINVFKVEIGRLARFRLRESFDAPTLMS